MHRLSPFLWCTSAVWCSCASSKCLRSAPCVRTMALVTFGHPTRPDFTQCSGLRWLPITFCSFARESSNHRTSSSTLHGPCSSCSRLALCSPTTFPWPLDTPRNLLSRSGLVHERFEELDVLNHVGCARLPEAAHNGIDLLRWEAESDQK